MSAYALNNDLSGGSVGFYGAENSPSSKENISNTIAKLEKQRDTMKNAKEQSGSDGLGKRINNLENRIATLQKRLEKLKDKEENGECETCKNRKYQDESDDPGVSFKSASKIAPSAVGAAVRGHENEHVVRERAKAEREGREVVSQSVVIKTAICPECGKSYVAGGETTTVTRTKPDNEQPNEIARKFDVGNYDSETEKGKFFDIVA